MLRGGVEVEGYTLHARAIAGEESCCYIDSIDVAFDMGCMFGKAASKSHVFITHGHVDHLAAFVAHASRRALRSMEPATYYAPAHLVPHLQNIMDSFSAMQQDSIAARFIAVEPGQEIHVDTKWMVKPFPTYHRVTSVGYLLYEKKNKLRPDLVGREGKEIAALKNAGEQVTSVSYSPEIAYTGDTTTEVFTSAEARGFSDLLRVKILITEATFLGDKKTSADATAGGHIHLDQLATLSDTFAAINAIVLVHVSARHALTDIHALVASTLPQELREKVVVMGRESAQQ